MGDGNRITIVSSQRSTIRSIGQSAIQEPQQNSSLFDLGGHESVVSSSRPQSQTVRVISGNVQIINQQKKAIEAKTKFEQDYGAELIEITCPSYTPQINESNIASSVDRVKEIKAELRGYNGKVPVKIYRNFLKELRYGKTASSQGNGSNKAVIVKGSHNKLSNSMGLTKVVYSKNTLKKSGYVKCYLIKQLILKLDDFIEKHKKLEVNINPLSNSSETNSILHFFQSKQNVTAEVEPQPDTTININSELIQEHTQSDNVLISNMVNVAPNSVTTIDSVNQLLETSSSSSEEEIALNDDNSTIDDQERGLMLANSYLDQNNVDFNPRQAIRILEELASSEKNVDAMYTLMEIYQIGIDKIYDNVDAIEKNPALEFEWGKMAAEHGHAAAMYYIGNLYFKGVENVIEVNDSFGFEWLLKAATQKNIDALNQVGYCYENAKGIKQDLFKSFQYYRKAADEGHSEGMANLAHLYEIGVPGIKKDLKCAIKWYKNAAELGNLQAKKIFCFHCTSQNNKIPLEQRKLGVIWFEEIAHEMAYQDNYSTILWNISMHYLHGCGVAKDVMHGLNLCGQAAGLGNVQAINLIAGTLAYGEFGVIQNIDAAVKLYEKSIELGEPNAMYHCGMLYLSHNNAQGEEQLTTRGLTLLKQAADSNNVSLKLKIKILNYLVDNAKVLDFEMKKYVFNALNGLKRHNCDVTILCNLARCHCYGIGTDQDKESAIRLFKEAVDNRSYNNYDVIFELAELIRDEYYKLSESLDEKKLGDITEIDAVNKLKMLVEKALENFPFIPYYERAAALGHTQAQFFLSLYHLALAKKYKNPNHIRIKNEKILPLKASDQHMKRAVEYLKQAADGGNIDAITDMTAKKLVGIKSAANPKKYVMPQDISEGLKYLSQLINGANDEFLLKNLVDINIDALLPAFKTGVDKKDSNIKSYLDQYAKLLFSIIESKLCNSSDINQLRIDLITYCMIQVVAVGYNKKMKKDNFAKVEEIFKAAPPESQTTAMELKVALNSAESTAKKLLETDGIKTINWRYYKP